VKNSKPRESAQHDESELARVRAEVMRALNEQPPNVTVLTAALERVDAMIDKARDELVAALDEFRELRDQGSEVPAPGRDLLTELSVLRGRDFFPWG
jgi:multidrug resistance efflux pump